MSKKEALVDTCFLHKITTNGKKIDYLKSVLSELEFQPVVHPYVAKNELDMSYYFKQLVDEGFIRIAEYDEFLIDEEDKEYYINLFSVIHDEIREYYENGKHKKKLERLELPPNQTIFTYRKSGMSLGDVHMILMAFFIRMPVIITEDSDINVLKGITKRHFNSELYSMEIYNTVDLLLKISKKETNTLTKKELLSILLDSGERAHQSELKSSWNEHHKI